MASNCTLGIQNLVKTTLNNKPWFEYDQSLGIVNILDSFAKKINKENSHGVAKTTAITINKQINDGYKNIGDIAFVKSNKEGRGYIDIAPTINQIYLINAQNEKEINELQQQLDEEELLKGFYQTRETGNYDVVDGEIVPFFENEANLNVLNNFQEEQKELDKIVTKINNESRQLDLFESFQNIITNENKPTPIDTTKSAGLLWGKMSSYESETNFQPTESKSQYRSDNSLQEKINGRSFKEIWNSNEFTQLERENILLHSIQERMLDKTTFNGELFAGINSKLGKLELRVVDNEKYPFLAFQKQIYINPKTFLKYLQNANIEDVDKYLDLTVSEELIHVLTNYFTSLEDIKKIATEINPNNFKYIQSIYKSLPSGDFELGTREYLRMIVQQEILGTTTEKIKYTKNGVIDSIIDKIWNFLYQIFKDNKGTLAENVKKHIDFIKSNNVDSTNNYKPNILQVETSLSQNIKYQLSKEQSDAIDNVFDENPELANSVYSALGFNGTVSLGSNLKNTGKTEQELIEYLKKKYPEIKLNITNNPIWEKGSNVLNQIIENEMNEEYWKNLYTQKNISNREEFESVKIPTIKNKFKPDFENVYHGTNTYEIDSNGNLILTPSKNFENKTTSISFTQIPVVAQDYMLRKEGNIIIKINNEALGTNYDIESAEEIAVNGNQLFIVPKGQYEIITVPTLAEKMRKKYANEVEIRAEELKNNAKSDLHLINAIYSERIAADNYSELQEYGDVDISEQAPEWYVPDEYLDSRAAKKVYEDILSKINKEWVINTLSNTLIEQIKNTGEYIESVETALNDISTYGGRYAPHQSNLFEELLNEIGLGYSQRSTYLEEGEKLEKAKQKQKEYNELLDAIESLVEKEAEKIIKYYNSPENVKLREEQKERDRINREITQNLTGTENIDDLPFQKIGDKIIGQANIKAMTVLIDAVNQKQDTLPHEYAHHYIAWFRDSKIVQEGIKRFGSEEALVQAIGEQVVAQKGEAYNWWKKFTNFILNLLSDKQVLQILTDSFLNRTDLNTDFSYNKITPQQKQQATFMFSEFLDVYLQDFEQVEKILKEEKIIDKKCS